MFAVCTQHPGDRLRTGLDADRPIDLVEIRQVDALPTRAADLPETIDRLLLDGAESLDPKVLALLESRLRPGAFVVADDADVIPEYLERVRSPERGCLSAAMSRSRCA